ncbi:tol-pal system protein YbgF [Blochmannia endosymbiont of Polyrhachis (Hedomyrma) turneri]|uniref:tol-pal system protein YbgF n=1 Tax=Blochmannia endosymbiont of Polyrhachis (Hedomyrma) turneri TaxID=1505596 RepID=UPI00061A60DC|nr:tol-pal system protein YbgF [Blochmannia endosymbiont of Polyrhachis (Hedomyrma) turneri]AKC59909.1 Uncharacterized protein YbgF [Blochmannia endosymbiont of Polyrhachis (Hedomyrma) turneri]
MKTYLNVISFNAVIVISLSMIHSINAYSNIANHKNIQNNITQLKNISHAHSECLINFQKQILLIEEDINVLRGQIQDTEHQLSKMIEQQKNIIQKIDGIIKKKSNLSNNYIDNNVIFHSKNTENIFHTNNDNNQHINDYNKAVSLVLENKQYEQAIQAFQKFILQYPNSVYQPNAHYWLGQLNYRKGNKHNASYHFALVAKKYPKSLKAADSLLKVGIIMQENGDNDNAKFIYKQINYLYPNSDAAKQIHKRLKQ